MTTITLPALPYGYEDLAPHISKETLEEIIVTVAGDASKAGVFNNAAQVWNHTFYWNCMAKNGGGKATGALAAKIDEAFGSYEKFAEEFAAAATTQFGSGWAWLVADKVNGELSILKTSNADTPLAHGKVAVLTIDVWEHAYYIDFRNARPKYISTFLESLVNWDYANAKYAGQAAGVEK
jgi:Fe-Mn family superoxide dismutase